MVDEKPDVLAIFTEALSRATHPDRGSYLDQACRDDLDLRQRVGKLLQAHQEAGNFLGGPASAGGTIEHFPIAERPGTLIGPYKLLQQIGEGGMGVVFMAEQIEPLQRTVALKIIKPGMDTRQVIARFEAERQAVAMMDHPNIAKVLDAGTTDSGRPYFVMELVKGVPITKYCDEKHLPLRARLELFVQVCQAVQHAHQKGIIHRDIKPNNVLVAEYDNQAVPKVIDFGVAKATAQRLTERTMFTEFGQVLGTMEYMSPEQSKFNQLDVDTRSDIYSLGVLLYELLAGSTPFEGKRLHAAAFDEMLRIIREEEPPKPSTRLSSLSLGERASSHLLPPGEGRGEGALTLASIAANRHSEPARLSKDVRGELDWIVMKALEKDRNRRYETASGFAADIERHLHDEPVEAGPPSASYRLRKFVRRNKGPVIAGVALAALLILGTVGTSIGLAWALNAERGATAAAVAEAQQRRVAETQRDRAQAAEKLATVRLSEVTREKQRATAAETRAKEETAVARAVIDFLRNDLLAEASPEKNARSKKVTVEELLGRASARISGKFEKQPMTEAAIRATIGHAYQKLGDYSAAQPHLERALELSRRVLGEEHLYTITYMSYLASLYRDQGHYAKAEPLSLKVLEVHSRVLGEEHSETLVSMSALAVLYQELGQHAKAEPICIKVLEVHRRVHGEEHPDTLTRMSNLAMVYLAQGQFAKAEPLFIKVLDVRRRVIGEEHPDTLASMISLGSLYVTLSQHARAEPLYVKALEAQRRVLGAEHPKTLFSMSGLASLYYRQDKVAEAQALWIETLEVQRRVLGEEHPDTLRSMFDLAYLYFARGQYTKAEPILSRVLEVRRRVLGEEHPQTLNSMKVMASLYGAQGEYVQAEALLMNVLEAHRRVRGPEHIETLAQMSRLARLYQGQRQYAKAEPILIKYLEASSRERGEEHRSTLFSMDRLASLYRDQGQYEKAKPLLVKLLKVSRRVLGEEHFSTLDFMSSLALLYQKQGQYAKAEPLFVKVLEVNRRVEEDEHYDTFDAMNNLALLYRDQAQYEKAEPLLINALEGRRKILGEGRRETLDSMINLAMLYERQGDLPKAEPLYREALEITHRDHGDASPHTGAALVSLGRNLLQQQKYADAEPLLREGLNIGEQKQPDFWETFDAKSILGGCLLGQQKYAEAEPLLLAGYEGIHERENMIPAAGKVCLTEAMERLVQLYDATARKEQAAAWKKQLEARRESEKKTEVPME